MESSTVQTEIQGQWLGTYDGTNSGTFILDVDKLGDHYEGTFYAWDSIPLLPSVFAIFITDSLSGPFLFRQIPVMPIDPRTGFPTEWKSISGLYPMINIPKVADANLSITEEGVYVTATTDIQTSIKAFAPRSRSTEPSQLSPKADVTCWADFKMFASDRGPFRCIYRGQECLDRLRTGFHRSGRTDLRRFTVVDRITLHRQLSGRTKILFDLNVPDQNGALLSLAQHHGYPTPPLDWTYSPYIAAFFAYRRITKARAVAAGPSEKVSTIDVF